MAGVLHRTRAAHRPGDQPGPDWVGPSGGHPPDSRHSTGRAVSGRSGWNSLGTLNQHAIVAQGQNPIEDKRTGQATDRRKSRHMMRRLRDTLRCFLTMGGLPLMLLLTHCSRVDNRPNLIVILTDDQGYGDLGCFGSATIKTPNIDRMAREGARLTSFYAAAPICTPTRAALMTGTYATRVGLTTPLHVYDDIGLNPAETTLAEALREQGYRTACIGKWHLGHRPRHYPTRHGFDLYWGTPLGHMFNRPEVGRAVGDASDLFLDNEEEIPFPDDADLTERLTAEATAFVRAKHDRPFFLLLSHTMPHEPLAASSRFRGRSEGEQPTRLQSSWRKSSRVNCSFTHVAIPQLGAGNQPRDARCKRPGRPSKEAAGATWRPSESGSLNMSE